MQVQNTLKVTTKHS